MNHPYSRGCGYNYRRSMQNNIAVAAENGCCETPPAGCPSPQNFYPECFPAQISLAMGYVPVQRWSPPLVPCKGFQIGTIFADLHKPFCGKGGVCR